MAAAMQALTVSTYALEMARAQKDVAALETIALRDHRDAEKHLRLAYRRFHLASLTNHAEHFAALERLINDLVRNFGPKEDICLLKANVDGRFHRLDGVKEALRMSPQLARRTAGRAILADVDFQEGRYQDARAALVTLIEQDRTWDNLARLAYWHSKLGDCGESDKLYEAAEHELTAKEMRSFAWLELQRGELALSRGMLENAKTHAARAAASFPGHWKNDEFEAKVLAAEGKLKEATVLLHTVADNQPKPELHQAIGELLAAQGRVDDARPWFESALASYLSSVNKGEVHYFHHLADFYADSGAQPREAVKWARKDVGLRENFSTQSVLAWALLRNGEIPEGLEWIQRALSSNAQDSGLFATAAELYGAAGDPVQQSQYQRTAQQINPLSQAIHLHL
jgi:tetratricopeptide (TPR) repeat protein